MHATQREKRTIEMPKCPLPVALLLLAQNTAHGSTTGVCPDGTLDYATFGLRTLRYVADTATFGSGIATQSEGCTLPVTPTARTFQIWGYIYNAQAALLLPNSLTDAERYHVSETYDATSDWLRAFTTDDGGDNADALAAIERMDCHISKARDIACETSPRAFACCAFSQYATWLKVASLLSRLILLKYGAHCGTPVLDDAAVLEAYADQAGALLRGLPDAGVGGEARRAALTTVAWALKGVANARNGDLPPLNATGVLETHVQLEALRHQSDVTFLTALACLPDAMTD